MGDAGRANTLESGPAKETLVSDADGSELGPAGLSLGPVRRTLYVSSPLGRVPGAGEGVVK